MILFQLYPEGTMAGAKAVRHVFHSFSLLSAAYRRVVHIAPFAIPQTPGGNRGLMGMSL